MFCLPTQRCCSSQIPFPKPSIVPSTTNQVPSQPSQPVETVSQPAPAVNAADYNWIAGLASAQDMECALMGRRSPFRVTVDVETTHQVRGAALWLCQTHPLDLCLVSCIVVSVCHLGSYLWIAIDAKALLLRRRVFGQASLLPSLDIWAIFA